MEKKFIKQYIPISSAIDNAIEYIRKRKDNEIVSLSTRWNKLNNQVMGGLEPNVIWTIVGTSGSGKSSFANTIETDLIDFNPSQDIVVLSFSFEMLSRSQIGRKLSNKLRQTTKTLYSAEQSIDDSLMTRIERTAEQMREYQIYYVDEPGTVKDIENTILYFSETIAKDKWLIVILDHTLLVDGLSGENALKTISDLQKMFIRVKKLPFTSIIQISQMNRNIEAPDRINNPSSHYPMRSDISSADTIFHASDYVMVLHRPELLGIMSYGPKHLQVRNKVYLHILKNRDAGEPAILEFENDLKYNNLIEATDEK